MSFSQKVNRLLKENGMTKATLSKLSGIPYTTLDSMLKRETDTARLEVVFKIAKALGTSVEELVFEDSPKSGITSEEKRILELYSLLDSRGKSTVLSILEDQADYSRKDEENRKKIPVFISPAAAGEGLPILSEEYSCEPVAEGMPQGKGLVAIPISGDSMEPLFEDGDLAYVAPAERVESGQIGVFILNGESLCKKYVEKEGEYFLVSLNPKYEPIRILESDEIKLVGKVVEK